MPSGTFMIEISTRNQIDIPAEIVNRLKLNEGDKVEILIKKIRSKRMDINITKNPLMKLLELSTEEPEEL
ncbi:MAG: AbrB/MazE/SpoVT family DNA-binding domain-containing protein [Calditrichaceae bacterium]